MVNSVADDNNGAMPWRSSDHFSRQDMAIFPQVLDDSLSVNSDCSLNRAENAMQHNNDIDNNVGMEEDIDIKNMKIVEEVANKKKNEMNTKINSLVEFTDNEMIKNNIVTEKGIDKTHRTNIKRYLKFISLYYPEEDLSNLERYKNKEHRLISMDKLKFFLK